MESAGDSAFLLASENEARERAVMQNLFIPSDNFVAAWSICPVVEASLDFHDCTSIASGSHANWSSMMRPGGGCTSRRPRCCRNLGKSEAAQIFIMRTSGAFDMAQGVSPLLLAMKKVFGVSAGCHRYFVDRPD